MKKILFFFLAMAVVFTLAPINSACGTEYQLIGRELSPGILQPSDAPPGEGIYNGALFIGKIFDGNSPVGYFSVVLDRVNEGVEICGATTEILEFKLVMNFSDRSRLVLVMKDGQQGIPGAFWWYDDNIVECLDKCVFPGYYHYLEYLYDGTLLTCDDVSTPSESLIAMVGAIDDENNVHNLILEKQWFGSWGSSARGVSGAEVSGWLVHTPLLIPAVFGTVTLY